MSLLDWLNEGRLRPHTASAREVAELLRIVDRDLADAAIHETSADRRFATAYNAALQLATVALAASGHRATGTGHHWLTLNALPEVLGQDARDLADYLDSCRVKRNTTDYDRAGEVSDAEVEEILREAGAFKIKVLDWLKANHPRLLE